MVRNATEENEVIAPKSRDRSKDRELERSIDKRFERTVETEPQPDTAKILAVGATVPLGLAAAALATSLLTNHERVAITAWIAVAVAGSASAISAAAVSHRRHVSIERGNQGTRSQQRLDEASRSGAE